MFYSVLYFVLPAYYVDEHHAERDVSVSFLGDGDGVVRYSESTEVPVRSLNHRHYVFWSANIIMTNSWVWPGS